MPDPDPHPPEDGVAVPFVAAALLALEDLYGPRVGVPAATLGSLVAKLGEVQALYLNLGVDPRRPPHAPE
jgi:hypothetical protein